MSESLPPFPTVQEFQDAVDEDESVKKIFDSIAQAFYDSYKKGHEGVDKQKAYLFGTSRIRRLDMHLVDIFNSMTYSQR